MIARLLPLAALQGEPHFHWRGGEVSRLEGLTDGVFGLAITLLILSTEVPQSYDELSGLLRGIPAFAACFALFGMLWYYHFQFHRRFGLENKYTVFLNLCLLFLILIYVYPAKYLFTELSGVFFFHQQPTFTTGLMLFYSGGVVSIFLLFMLMHVHAHRHREVLAMSAMEVHLTRAAIREHQIHMGVGLCSMGLALSGSPQASGIIYMLVGPLQGLNGWLWGRAARRHGLLG